MNKLDKNISRFETIISKIEPLYKAYHRDSDVETMKKLLQKASINSVSVLICGEFKRGKSSFINAFLDENICPTDHGIATSVVSIIEYGPIRKVTRFYGDVQNLQSEVVPFEDIVKYAKGTSMEIDNTIMLVIELPSDKLKDGLVLIDTPGVGGLDPRHLFLTLYVMPKADATFFVVDASEPMSSTELDFYRQKVLQYSPSAKIILNKSDLKSKDELEQLIVDTKRKIVKHCKNVEECKSDIIPISSRHWSMYNKNKSDKMKKSSNCETVDSVLRSIVPSYKWNVLINLKSILFSTLASIIEKLEYQVSQIEAPNLEAQKKYKSRLLELKVMKDDLANPISPTRKKIDKVIHTTQTNVINDLTKQSILFSTDRLNQLLKRPEAKSEKWVLDQLNIGLESIVIEVDQRILSGFTEVNTILGENVEVPNDSFREPIPMSPSGKGGGDFASKACNFARNTLSGMGIASMTGLALSLFCAPIIIGLGSLGAAAAYIYKSTEDQNTQSRICELKTRLTPQITIVMNDLRAYVQHRFETFNDSLVESFKTMTSSVVEEMQQVMADLKNIDDDTKAAAKLKEQIQKELNFASVYHKQVELLLTNPFEKK